MTAVSATKEQWQHRFERFMLLLLWINPFLDIFNGIYTYILSQTTRMDFAALGISITPSLLVRMLILAGMLVYIFLTKDKPALLTLFVIGAVWLMTAAGMFFFAAHQSVSFFADVQYIARFVFNLCVLLLYGKIIALQIPNREKALSFLANAFAWTLAMLSSSILLCSLLGIGYSTYADRYGYRGSRGFFYAGNDITAILMVLLPLIIGIFLALPKQESKRRLAGFVYACGSTLAALLLIGSKTAFVAALVSCGVGAICALWTGIAKKGIFPLLRFGFAVLTCGAIFFVLMLPDLMQKQEPTIVGDIKTSWETTGKVLEREGATTAILSGRQVKMLSTFDEVKSAGPYAFVFGLGRGSQSATIEMDLFEFLFYYGIFGTIALLWVYVKAGMGAFWRFLRWPNPIVFGGLAGLGMTVGYGFMAGHVFFSVTSGFYLAIVLVFCGIWLQKQEKQEEEHAN